MKVVNDKLWIVLPLVLVFLVLAAKSAPVPIGSSDANDVDVFLSNGRIDLDGSDSMFLSTGEEDVMKRASRSRLLRRAKAKARKNKAAWHAATAKALAARKKQAAARMAWMAAEAQAGGKPNCSGPKSKRLREAGLMTEDCKATNKTVEGVKKMIKFNPSSPHPQWAVRSNCFDKANSANKKVRVCKKCFRERTCPWCGKMWWKPGAKSIKRCYGEEKLVYCPCTSAAGGKMKEHEAFSLIFGQLATMEVTGPMKFLGPNQVLSIKFDRMRSALASSMMLDCWRHRCAVNSTAQANDMQTLLSANLELESRSELGDGRANVQPLQSLLQWSGAGANCGAWEME